MQGRPLRLITEIISGLIHRSLIQSYVLLIKSFQSFLTGRFPLWEYGSDQERVERGQTGFRGGAVRALCHRLGFLHSTSASLGTE